jgi:hypothetical protein
MNIAGIVTVALATVGLAACSSSVEGTYKLDTALLKKAMATEVAGQSGGGIVFDFFTNAIDQVEMTLELQANGKVTFKSRLPTGGWAGPGRLQWSTREDKHGMWKTVGEAVVVTADGNSLTCARSWARLNCQSPKKRGLGEGIFFFPLIFVKS